MWCRVLHPINMPMVMTKIELVGEQMGKVLSKELLIYFVPKLHERFDSPKSSRRLRQYEVGGTGRGWVAPSQRVGGGEQAAATF